MNIAEQRQLLLDLRVTVQLGTQELSLQLWNGAKTALIELPSRIVHRGLELKLIVPVGADLDRKSDPVLLKLVVLARAAQLSLASGKQDPGVKDYAWCRLQDSNL